MGDGLVTAIDALNEVRALVASCDGRGGDVAQIDLLDALRRTESACAAARIRTSVAFAKARVIEAQARGESLEQQRDGAVGELALVLRRSPVAMMRDLASYRRLVVDLPGVLRVLASGETSEYAAICIARAGRMLTGADASALDAHLARQLAGLTARQAEGRARRFADARDPKAAARRMREAAGSAHVSSRPLGDNLAQLSIVTTTAEVVAMYAALRKAALAHPGLKTNGIGRTMANLAFQRITGAEAVADVDIEIQLVMDTDTFLGNNDDPARVADEYTGMREAWIPGPLARDLAFGTRAGNGDTCAPREGSDGTATSDDGTPGSTSSADSASATNDSGSHGSGAEANDGRGTLAGLRDVARDSDPSAAHRRAAADAMRGRRWIRRLLTDPVTGTLTDCDRRRRRFTTWQRRFIAARDQACTTPWCGGPIRDYDHATPYAAGGPTDTTNGNGKSTKCNHTKDARGWKTEPIPAAPGRAHGIKITTPTGHIYTSTSPPVLGSTPDPTRGARLRT